MKKVILILSVLLFTSCEEEVKTEYRVVYACDCEQQKKVAEFVKESILNANNKSDEEMEDVISQLEQTAVRLNCSQTKVKFIKKSNESSRIDQVDKGINYYEY